MPSPLAHIGASLGLYAVLLPGGARPRPRDVALITFASVAPDLDIPLGMALGNPVGWHHGPTHSLLGAALAGALLALLTRDRPGRIAAALGCLLHVPLDWSTGDPAEAAQFGVPLLWPLLETKFIAPWTLFGAYNIDREGFLLNMIAPEAAAVWARELLFVAAVVACAGLIRRLRS